MRKNIREYAQGAGNQAALDSMYPDRTWGEGKWDSVQAWHCLRATCLTAAWRASGQLARGPYCISAGSDPAGTHWKRWQRILPVNILTLDPPPRKAASSPSANRTSIVTLKRIREHLPQGLDPEKIVGTSFDIFHKRPEHQRAIVGRSEEPALAGQDQARVRSGSDLNITPVFDVQGPLCRRRSDLGGDH